MNLSTTFKLPGIALILLSILFYSAHGFASETLASGSFKGTNGHSTKGRVKVIKTASGLAVELGSNFKFDGAPDPKVGFGKSGSYDIKSQLGILQSDFGKQTYAIPASLNIESYDEIYIWCEKYSVSLGVAKIK